MTSRLALVLLTTSFPIRSDGSEAAGSFVLDLCERLCKDIDVRVVAPGPRSINEPWAPGLDVFRFAAPGKPLSTLRPWLPADLFHSIRVLRSGLEATSRAVVAGTTSHVLALWALPCGAWARHVLRDTGIGYSVWTLGSDIWTLGRIPIVRQLLARVLRDARTCYSDGLQLAADTERIAGRPVEFLPSTRRINGDVAVARRTDARLRLLFVGRWHPNKGVDLLLDALHLLADEDWSLIESVTICGGGPMQDEVDARVRMLQAVGRPLKLLGYLNKSAAVAVMQQADFLLIPSRIESIPLVFSDAMKLGCPVIAMPTGDLPDLVTRHPPCGLLASSIDALAYRDAIRSALTAGSVGFSAGVADRATLFDLDAIARRLIADIRSACSA